MSARCRCGMHDWDMEFHGTTLNYYFKCSRCSKARSAPPPSKAWIFPTVVIIMAVLMCALSYYAADEVAPRVMEVPTP